MVRSMGADAKGRGSRWDVTSEGKRPTSAKGRYGPRDMRAPALGRALTVLELGALSDLDNVTVRIADVAARLAVLRDRLGDELGSSTFP